MTKAFNVFILAAGLAGCAGGTPSPTDTRNQTDRTQPPGEGAFGNAFTWEWRKKEPPAPASTAPAATPPAAAATANTGKPDASASERQEFEEWRAWQGWKRNNPK